MEILLFPACIYHCHHLQSKLYLHQTGTFFPKKYHPQSLHSECTGLVAGSAAGCNTFDPLLKKKEREKQNNTERERRETPPAKQRSAGPSSNVAQFQHFEWNEPETIKSHCNTETLDESSENQERLKSYVKWRRKREGQRREEIGWLLWFLLVIGSVVFSKVFCKVMLGLQMSSVAPPVASLLSSHLLLVLLINPQWIQVGLQGGGEVHTLASVRRTWFESELSPFCVEFACSAWVGLL